MSYLERLFVIHEMREGLVDPVTFFFHSRKKHGTSSATRMQYIKLSENSGSYGNYNEDWNVVFA